MGPSIAFNAYGIQGTIARDGFRVYLESGGVYFIRVGNLDRLTAAGREGDYVGTSDRNFWLAFFIHPFFLFLPGRESRAGGAEVLRMMEEKPLRERLADDRANFVARPGDFLSSAIRPGGGSFWRKGYGTWGFRLRSGRLAVLEFHSDLDRLVAQRHLAALLGSTLEVQTA
jgi:hypothetical protein